MENATSYDDDILAWSQEQAALLRGLAARPRGLPNGLDLEHVAEEIEDVGKSELRTVESFVELLLRHLIKLASAPDAPAARHWRGEAELQHQAVCDDLKRSMRREINVDKLWRAAQKRADAALDEHGNAVLPGLPERCPFSLDDLIADPFAIDDAVVALRASANS